MTTPTAWDKRMPQILSLASSEQSSKTAITSVNKSRVATGHLILINQKHQYGFIVSEKEDSNILFLSGDAKRILSFEEFLSQSMDNYSAKFLLQIHDFVQKYESGKKTINISLLFIITKS